MTTVTPDQRPTATLVREDLVNFQPTSNLYQLSEPHQGNNYVVVTVAESPDSNDSTVVTASDENGFARTDSTQRAIHILHRAENRTYTEALADIGYDLT